MSELDELVLMEKDAAAILVPVMVGGGLLSAAMPLAGAAINAGVSVPLHAGAAGANVLRNVQSEAIEMAPQEALMYKIISDYDNQINELKARRANKSVADMYRKLKQRIKEDDLPDMKVLE